MIKPIAVWSLVIGLIAAMSFAGGCSLDKVVQVDVPPTTREHMRENLGVNVPPTVTLRDARILRSEGDRKLEAKVKQQVADHIASNESLDAEIADGSFVESLLGSAVNTGIETAIPGIATIPGGAILTTLLGGVAGYLTRRTPKAVLDAEYDLGVADALKIKGAGKNEA